MAMSLSRTCTLRARLLTPAALFPPPSCVDLTFVTRAYATESAFASKRQGSAPPAKATHSTTNLSSTAPKKIPAKVEKRTARHTDQSPAASEGKALAGSSKSKTAKATKADVPSAKENIVEPSTKHAPPKPELSLEEQQLQELEAIEIFKKVMRTADPFGQPISSSLDVALPRPAGLTRISQYGSLRNWWKQLIANRVNGAKNFMSLLYLASDDALPGVTLGRVPWYKSFSWLFKASKATSTKQNVWIAPLRQIALQTYRDLNQAVASRDMRTVKNLAAAQYQTELLRRVKKQQPNFLFKWNLEREVSPTQILSIRATQFYMGKEEPKLGSRYLVHALVKFDTEQSLECYGPNGEALHEAVDDATKRADGTTPAKSKRVTEYLVIEKRMWYDAPWVLREQKWDVSQPKT